jgi:hypothetical protein
VRPLHPETTVKLLPILLLNLCTVVVALVVYDQLRSDRAPPAAEIGDAGAEDASVLQRLDALEAARRPTLQVSGADAGVLTRLTALEAALGEPTSTPSASTEVQPDLEGRTPSSPAPWTASDEPTEEELRRFRKLAAAARARERVEKLAAHVDKRLAKLPIELSTGQRAKIQAAYADFRPRIGEIWAAAKTEAQETMKTGGSVDTGELVETTSTRIQQEFVGMIDGIVSAGDAESIAGVLLDGGK